MMPLFLQNAGTQKIPNRRHVVGDHWFS